MSALDFTPSALSCVEGAHSAMSDLQSRHESARRAVAEFALRAFVEGVPVDQIMTACRFEAPDAVDDDDEESITFSGGLFGFDFGPRTPANPRDVFARWLGAQVEAMVKA